jgi:Fic family protein
MEEWILYMLEGVEQTANETVELVESIYALMNKTKNEIREKLPKIYSKDLVEVLFIHPYTKIDFLISHLGVHRDTASKYLNELEKLGIVKNIKIGRSKFFVHKELFDVLKKGI